MFPSDTKISGCIPGLEIEQKNFKTVAEKLRCVHDRFNALKFMVSHPAMYISEYFDELINSIDIKFMTATTTNYEQFKLFVADRIKEVGGSIYTSRRSNLERLYTLFCQKDSETEEVYYSSVYHHVIKELQKCKIECISKSTSTPPLRKAMGRKRARLYNEQPDPILLDSIYDSITALYADPSEDETFLKKLSNIDNTVSEELNKQKIQLLGCTFSSTPEYLRTQRATNLDNQSREIFGCGSQDHQPEKRLISNRSDGFMIFCDINKIVSIFTLYKRSTTPYIIERLDHLLYCMIVRKILGFLITVDENPFDEFLDTNNNFTLQKLVQLILFHHCIESIPPITSKIPIVKLTFSVAAAKVDISKIKRLSISRLGLTSLDETLFDHLPNLEELDISENKLTSLTNRHFRSLNRLKILNIDSNTALCFGENVFSPCQFLWDLSLTGCGLVSIDLKMFYLFAGWSFIKRLYLSSNNIRLSPCTKQFVGLYSLQYLGLSNNDIGPSLVDNQFEGLEKLQFLYLNNNQISTISNNAFKGLDSLRLLSLHRNIIRSLDTKMFEGLTQLRSLFLSNNNIGPSLCTNLFEGLPSLKCLDISYNQIETLATNPFRCLTKLYFLDISHNAIEEIGPETFCGLIDLVHLDLTHNKITRKPDGVFYHYQNIYI